MIHTPLHQMKTVEHRRTKIVFWFFDLTLLINQLHENFLENNLLDCKLYLKITQFITHCLKNRKSFYIQDYCSIVPF